MLIISSKHHVNLSRSCLINVLVAVLPVTAGEHRGQTRDLWEPRQHGASPGLSQEERELARAIHRRAGGMRPSDTSGGNQKGIQRSEKR